MGGNFTFQVQDNFLEYFFGGLKNESHFLKKATFNMSRLEAPAGFFRLRIKGVFNPYAPLPFDKTIVYT